MKFGEIEELFERLRSKPLRTVLVLIAFLASVFVLAAISKAGGNFGETNLMEWWQAIFAESEPEPTCDDLRQTDLERWLLLCEQTSE